MTSQAMAVVLGVDVGTGGVRTLAADAGGNILAAAQTALSARNAGSLIHEQDPQDWWRAVCSTLRSVVKELIRVTSPDAIQGIAVTSTSGSLVLADSAGQPVRPAILYDDTRGASIAEELNRRLPREVAQFNSSYSLVKAAWVRQEEPAVWARARHLLHPADWLAGKLTGEFGTSDDSNALKLGYDLESGSWSAAVPLLSLPAEILPHVIRPGGPVGVVCDRASGETGLKPGTAVFAGATDGMTALIASGARESGQANTTLGTTMVWKVLSQTKPRLSPEMYCHRHPSDLWAPGAASNSGPGSLRPEGSGAARSDLDRQAALHLPTQNLCYLLPSRGERFPFLNPEAETFFEGLAASPHKSHAAQLQSLAFVERWGYERLEEWGVTVGRGVFSTGSAAASPTLSQLRASVLQREVHLCDCPTSAFGASILAASEPLHGGDLKSAIQGMIRVRECYQPDLTATGQYDEIYGLFRAACARRGYA